MGIYIQADMDKLNALTPSGEAKKKKKLTIMHFCLVLCMSE